MASGEFVGKIGHHLFGASICMRVDPRTGIATLTLFSRDVSATYRDVTAKENDGQPSNNLLLPAEKSANIKG